MGRAEWKKGYGVPGEQKIKGGGGEAIGRTTRAANVLNLMAWHMQVIINNIVVRIM